MKNKPGYRRLGHYFDIPPRWRWVFWPVVAFGSGGTAVAMWLSEEAVMVSECAPLAVLPGLATLIYWFNHRVFKAAKPRHEDLSRKTPSRDNHP